MASKDIVTEKSVSFLQSIFDSTKRSLRHARPISTLPYSKETMKEVLKKYIFSLSKDDWNKSLEHSIRLCIVKSLYLSLADFIDDNDSIFLNKTWNITDENLWFKNAKERERYETVVNAKEDEREEMNAEINTVAPILCSINLLTAA